MLINKTVKVTFAKNNKKKYEKLGYLFTEYGKEFDCKVEHLGKSSDKYVKVKCDYCGDIFNKQWGKYTKNVGKDCCVKCVGKKRKDRDIELNRRHSSSLSKDDIIKEFKKAGYVAIVDYENYKDVNTTKIKYICPNHPNENLSMKIRDLRLGHRCPYCYNDRRGDTLRLNEKDVFNYYEERGLKILDGQSYKNKDTKLAWVCPNHNKEIQYISLRGLKKTKIPCKFCRFNNSMTTISLMIRQRLSNWKAEIILSNDNRCALTGSPDFDIHHLIPLNIMIRRELEKRRISMDKLIGDNDTTMEFVECIVSQHNNKMGICLDKKLHTQLHSKYGDSPTEKDWIEFKESIK